MDKNSSLIRVLRWKKGFFVASFVFYLLFFGGILLFLYRVLRLESAGVLVDDVRMLLYGLYVPVFLVQLFECYLWGGTKTGEYILSLPVKRNTVFFVSTIGHFLVFSLVWMLFYFLLAIMLRGSGEDLITLFHGQMLVAYMFTFELYLLTQLFTANCKNKQVALFLALVLNVLKYVVFGGHPRMCDFHQNVIYRYLTIFGGQELLDYQAEGGTWIYNLIMINGGIIAVYLLLILLSVWKQREETAGLFYYSWFRFGIIVIIGFYLVHFGWDMIGNLRGDLYAGFNVFTELLWLGGSVGIYWCLQRYLTGRGGVR